RCDAFTCKAFRPRYPARAIRCSWRLGRFPATAGPVEPDGPSEWSFRGEVPAGVSKMFMALSGYLDEARQLSKSLAAQRRGVQGGGTRRSKLHVSWSVQDSSKTVATSRTTAGVHGDKSFLDCHLAHQPIRIASRAGSFSR